MVMDRSEVILQFNDYVNMSADELSAWLETPESEVRPKHPLLETASVRSGLVLDLSSIECWSEEGRWRVYWSRERPQNP